MRPILQPQKKRQPKPDQELRTSKQCKSKLICFNRKNYDKEEYDRQLQMQQDAINEKSPQQNVSDINNYNPADRVLSQLLQDAEKQSYIAENKTSYISQYGIFAWNSHISSLNALHRLDMVAGGKYYDIDGMGNSNINKSIGSHWNQKQDGATESRKDELKNHAEDAAKNKCPMQVTLSTCEGPVASKGSHHEG